VRACAFGERAVLVDLEVEGSPSRATLSHAVAAALARALPDADVVVGGGVVVVHGAMPAGAIDALAAIARRALADPHASSLGGRAHVLRVAYDGPDLEPVAGALGLRPADVVSLHAEREYAVELVGFLPGFAYLGPLDPRLVVPRRRSPRPIVAAGSVGIAGGFTGVYPSTSPGGWTLLGRALDAVLFDPRREPPALLAPGDRVRFEPAAAADARSPAPARPAGAAPAPMPARAVVLERTPPGTTIQDAGRPGLLSRGLPPSGPLDSEAFDAANVAVGNRPGAAALEIPLGELELRTRGSVLASIDGEPARLVQDGERLVVPAVGRAVRYLALRGGAGVPLVLGARATLPAARLGGLEGRPLRRGDAVPIGDDRGLPAPGRSAALAEPPVPAVLDLDPGPHVARFPPGALEALVAGPWRVSRHADRVGTRLEGARVPREGADLGLPAPMVRGAIQIATDGTPIVLGPDHPTTGGYPVLAVVRRASWPLAARLRPGTPVTLRIA
jgi:KipI family sensor histidine kinase inhibitor